MPCTPQRINQINLQYLLWLNKKRALRSQAVRANKVCWDTVGPAKDRHQAPTHRLQVSFWHLKRGIQDFHMNYLLLPADKAVNNVVCVWRLYNINTLERELVDTNSYKKQPSLSERVIVDGHGCHTALNFSVKAKENQDRFPVLYWLPKLHKKPYKARFIANSSSCTTTELSKLLTSCLTAV